MRNTQARKMIKGMSTANPVDIEKAYIDKTVEYAINRGFTHYQFIGPIHDFVKGNIDGMTLSRKYSKFNNERDLDYVNLNLSVVNDALEKLREAGIKSYMWHHELDLPTNFSKEYPEILNENGDIEVSHPLVRDYLENRILDFFTAYPKMDGIILTLHETKVPLLKLKNQKLGKIERVKYVTQILYDSCKALNKELIVRPFASVPEDYDMMLKAYESISKDLVVMDKWTQYDWSLTLPDNQFFYQIKNNPLFVETDIFGEYFGKGRLPIMLKDHIKSKFAYCEKFSPIGYVNRIDREGKQPFGTVNSVNLEIMNALMSGKDVDQAITNFFDTEYPLASRELQDIMSYTEDVNRQLLNLKNYYFMEGSFFPELNHCKNHFFFEIMKDDYHIASNEWFIPKNWVRGDLDGIFAEKDYVVSKSTELFERVKKLETKIDKEKYSSIKIMFTNLYYASMIWRTLVDILYDYVKYFEKNDVKYEISFYESVDKLVELDEEGRKIIGDNNDYHMNGYMYFHNEVYHVVKIFAKEVVDSFEAEKKTYFDLQSKNYVDFIVCGGALESHKLQKEVNFSDTMLVDGKLCRIPGNRRGAEWSQINGHGWFSYEVKVTPNSTNAFTFEIGSLTEKIDVQITVNNKTFAVSESSIKGKTKLYTFTYDAKNENAVRVKIERTSPYTPQIYAITVK